MKLVNKKERPEFCTDEHLEYLDELRESGATNMFGAGAYIQREFMMSDREEAAAIVTYWTNSFAQRHNIKEDSNA